MRLGLFSALITVLAILVLAVLITAFKHRVNANKKNFKRTSYRCAGSFCEIMVKAHVTGSKFCEFHTMVQKHLLILIENKDPMEAKAAMYMASNGNIFLDKNKYEKIEEELSSLSSKYKK